MTTTFVRACLSLLAVVPPSSVAYTQQVAVTGRQSAVSDRSASVLQRVVTVRLERAPARLALEKIAGAAHVRLQYDDVVLALIKTPVSLDAKQMPLGTAMGHVLAGTQLQAVPLALDVVGIGIADGAMAQGVILGKVINAKTKQPIAGATVSVDDLKSGIVTASDGSFRISAADGERRLAVRAVGFVRNTRSIVMRDGQTTTIEILLEPSASVLDEVIVTGSVVATERRAIPTPITVITAKDIEQRGITKLEQLFRGDVPGLFALDRGSAVYAQELVTNNVSSATNWGGTMNSALYSRGSSTLSGEPNPIKTYVDGVELLDPSYLGTIDLQSIERIEIITGPQAATVYGSGALGGVMQIFTKRGMGASTPEVVVALGYGILQNSISTGRAPTHHHTLNISGGTGAQFSYSANASYDYTGQWQPDLFSRSHGAQVGMTHSANDVTVSGSVGMTAGGNGLISVDNSRGTPYMKEKQRSGEWWTYDGSTTGSLGKKATSVNQTLSFSVDYRVMPSWSHHGTVGRSQNKFAFVPFAPVFSTPRDSSYQLGQSSGSRFTFSYNTTWIAALPTMFSSTLTVGANGSNGEHVAWFASAQDRITSSLDDDDISRGASVKNYGGFGSWRIGLFDRLFLTLGLRGESNANYGRDNAFDWTPTNGLAYTHEVGDLAIKLLGSYGRATKAPASDARAQVLSRYDAGAEPAVTITQFANPNLGPEYERGPQGGFEVYFGNMGSFTLNTYRQLVTDLLQRVVVDSVTVVYPGYSVERPQFRWMNVAKIRKHGWEATGHLNVGVFSLKGAWSWNDSRILEVAQAYSGPRYQAGQSALLIPSHTGSVALSYAREGTHVALVSNFVGRKPIDWASLPIAWEWYFSRIRSYISNVKKSGQGWFASGAGYSRSDLNASHRIGPKVSLTLNITNIGNSFDNDSWATMPSLGRITRFGLTFRFP